jgi:ribosomal protein S13
MLVSVGYTNKSSLKRIYGIGSFIFKLMDIRLGHSLNNTRSLNNLNSTHYLASSLNIKQTVTNADDPLNVIFEELKQKISLDTKLRDNVFININTLKTLNTYKGVRHMYSLPVHGQRTHTNARTQKSKKLGKNK